MNKRLFIYIILLMLFSCKTTQVTNFTYAKTKRSDYILKYNNLAIREMKRSGILASITLAQALLESDNGNSTLARNANNHFGVKCHNSWKGKKIYHDDDRRKECFRKYNSVYESYRDHTNFIKNGNRYRFLFKIKKNNYKAWAKGLQKAGYATNNKYASMLIKIIEENKLYRFDNNNISNTFSDENVAINNNSRVVLPNNDDFSFSINKHKIFNVNRIEYIFVKKNDTYESLNEEFDLLSWELAKYNELEKDTELIVNQILFLQPKRNKADVRHEYHVVKEGETMHSISQLYGVKLRKLYAKNNLKKGKQPAVGVKIWLRKNKKD
ncbi:MAG: glucosaminidase domain-containing protein [Bacteroidales bacterium]|nr:glucosaminidase domain-containing protein [Bacteroidales bacterium]